MWLGLTALSKKDRDDLLGAPVSTEGLFGSVTTVTQRFRRLEEERVQLSRMLPLALPQRGEREPTVRRRERRRSRAPTAPAASPASSAGSAGQVRFQHPRCQAGRSRRASAPAPWRVGVHRPPVVDGRWKEVSRRRGLSPPRTRGRTPPPPSMMMMCWCMPSIKMIVFIPVIPFHNPTLHHNVVCTDSPLAAPVVTPVKEATMCVRM